MTKMREEDHKQAWMEDFFNLFQKCTVFSCMAMYKMQSFTLEVHFKKCGADS